MFTSALSRPFLAAAVVATALTATAATGAEHKSLDTDRVRIGGNPELGPPCPVNGILSSLAARASEHCEAVGREPLRPHSPIRGIATVLNMVLSGGSSSRASEPMALEIPVTTQQVLMGLGSMTGGAGLAFAVGGFSRVLAAKERLSSPSSPKRWPTTPRVPSGLPTPNSSL